MTATGVVPAAFPDTGLSLCSLSGDQFIVSLVSDGLNGAYVMWEDRRDEPTSHSDVYAMRFTREGGVGSDTSVTPPAPPPSRIALGRPAPNPTSGSCTFQLSLPARARVRVDVLDLSGRVVSTLLDEAESPGTIPLRWTGRDRDRKSVASGIYLVRARAGNDEVVRRIALIQ